MITDKQLKSGLKRCKGHKYNTLKFKYAGKGYLECPKCHGYLKSPSKSKKWFNVKFTKSKFGFDCITFENHKYIFLKTIPFRLKK